VADESSKSRQLWGALESSVLAGQGIDIGCGDDPVSPNVVQFDRAQGDANDILRYVQREFDFVYASHCLEHMVNPRTAIAQWWQLVKPGGVLFLIVPDEDLYEQGYWPSRFNRDHKWTFTIAKHGSWSPVSINLLDLASSLPNSELVDIRLFDDGYDRRLQRHAGALCSRTPAFLGRALGRLAYAVLRGLGANRHALKARYIGPVDQTTFPGAFAQIQCIVRKKTPDDLADGSLAQGPAAAE
jgi:SAM-dependent methyltransferase